MLANYVEKWCGFIGASLNSVSRTANLIKKYFASTSKIVLFFKTHRIHNTTKQYLILFILTLSVL